MNLFPTVPSVCFVLFCLPFRFFFVSFLKKIKKKKCYFSCVTMRCFIPLAAMCSRGEPFSLPLFSTFSCWHRFKDVTELNNKEKKKKCIWGLLYGLFTCAALVCFILSTTCCLFFFCFNSQFHPVTLFCCSLWEVQPERKKTSVQHPLFFFPSPCFCYRYQS
ncbi:hypothetical protein, unlikely [Trypanosoma brucei gambiense DAL972]|uniref:Uncharacterized protein n=1 Tax=Trypanosoma brucei gambiense (strain MHOM/CI/86/DAL972) TaxID=679716 RepID=C9ZU80_TRYB9|nr:hypothetical protein, unlikely [Trypanosoma brucei gambiense DAL972]CBH12966.1 hypothetical protein, unlikely [Trypanosoma brucei gambiense DAL972]|eukprot:XP_011775245.1 hypothetical protein, unlikely [Trypanosoma brucei gambiense DAL972]